MQGVYNTNVTRGSQNPWIPPLHNVSSVVPAFSMASGVAFDVVCAPRATTRDRCKCFTYAAMSLLALLVVLLLKTLMSPALKTPLPHLRNRLYVAGAIKCSLAQLGQVMPPVFVRIGHVFDITNPYLLQHGTFFRYTHHRTSLTVHTRGHILLTWVGP